ncbi:MAG: carboxypeptidase-like regulatory domain-containing protein, partial [Dysgonamonadaceae bacterium]|nr:carboxypeptidase-like regulatory domain-containing protein [Dysgonamonadaceae bacterium]
MKQMICAKKEGEEDLLKVGLFRTGGGRLLIIRSFLIVFLVLFSVGTMDAQGLTVKGTVVDSQDEPLIGATIKVVNGTAGTVAGVDGSFTL